MESADKKLYWRKVESKKGETKKPKSITDLKNAMERIPQDTKQQEEQRQIFMEDRAKEVLIYRERIVEATTLEELSDVKALILDRISLVGDRNIRDYPNVKQTLKELKILSTYVDAEIAAFKPQTNHNLETFHPEIFKEKGFLIFDEFVKSGKFWFSDCSYAYRRMREYDKPRLIHDHIKPGMFLAWVNENYPEKDDLLKEVKPISEVKTDARARRYDLVKRLHEKK